MANAGHIIVKNKVYARPIMRRRGSDQAPPVPREISERIASNPYGQKIRAQGDMDKVSKVKRGIETQVQFEKVEAAKRGKEFNEHKVTKHWEGVANRKDIKD